MAKRFRKIADDAWHIAAGWAIIDGEVVVPAEDGTSDRSGRSSCNGCCTARRRFRRHSRRWRAWLYHARIIVIPPFARHKPDALFVPFGLWVCRSDF